MSRQLKNKKSGAYYRRLKKYNELWNNCELDDVVTPTKNKIHINNSVAVYRCNADLGNNERIGE